jgi:hypothetical protein
MDVTIGTQVDAVFTTQSPATGALQDADSLPTGTVYKNGVADALSVTVTNLATGVYKAVYTPTSAAGFSPGDDVSCVITATVGGVAGGGVIRQDRIKDVGGSVVSFTNARNLLTASYVTQYTCPANKTATVYMNAANVETGTPADRELTVRIVPDGDTPGDEHIQLRETVEANGTLGDNIGPFGPFILVEGDLIQAKADVTDDVSFRLEVNEIAVPS